MILNIDWYTATKDIIIPIASLLATVTLGTIIAFLLKNKEERAKLKTLLIDTYMLYLKSLIKLHEYQANNITYVILKDICISYDHYFSNHANSHNTKNRVFDLRDKMKKLRDTSSDSITEWSYFTYNFTFLLGKKKYFKNVLPLENALVDNYFHESAQEVLIKKIKARIIEDEDIVSGMNSLNLSEVDNSLDKIVLLIARLHNELQTTYFKPYNNKIADLIADY